MATEYKIYLVNQSSDEKNFWCFLDTPVNIPGKKVFANSSASIVVPAGSQNTNWFTVPLQYSLQAGASNRAVGLNVVVNSNIQENVELGQLWDANYYTVKDGRKRGPDLSLDTGTGVEKECVGAATNDYIKSINLENSWYESLTFGIQTQDGFMGVTWDPSPGENYNITPKFAFYIATGDFQENKLAAITAISSSSARVQLTDFNAQKQVWVILLPNGKWTTSKTKPSAPKLLASDVQTENLLLESHLHLSRAHSQLVAYATGASSDTQYNTIPFADNYLLSSNDVTIEVPVKIKVEDVKWDGIAPSDAQEQGANPVFRGVVTVAAAVAGTITAFACSGVTFRAHGVTAGSTHWNFSYNGPAASAKLLKAGALITSITRSNS